jgi:hypothetical protein
MCFQLHDLGTVHDNTSECPVLSSCYIWLLHAILFSVQDENELTETEKKKLSLQETRRSLPIFPFRNDLIQAIENNQVSHPYSCKVIWFFSILENSWTSLSSLELIIQKV